MGVADSAAPIEHSHYENVFVLIMAAVSIISTIIYLYKIRSLEKEKSCLLKKVNTPPPVQSKLKIEINELPTVQEDEEPIKKKPKQSIKDKPITQKYFNRMARDKGYKDTNKFISDIHQYKEIGKLPAGQKITKLMVSRAIYAQEQGWAN